MNARRRSGLMGGPVGSAPKNTNTQLRSKETQAEPVRNAHNKPKATGYTKVRNAVNG